MKKLLLSTFTLFSLGIGVLEAQINSEHFDKAPSSAIRNREVALNPDRVACALDISDYPGDKVTGQFIAGWWVKSDGWQALSQRYEAPEPINIFAVSFIARKMTGTTITLRTSIFNVNAQGLPTGTAIATKDSIMSHAAQPALAVYQIPFAAPAAVSANYAIVVECLTPGNNIAIYTNDDEEFDGAQEDLSGIKQGNTWFSAYANDLDMDALFSPIYSTVNSTANFTSSASTVCLGATVNLTNTSSSIFNSRFYNLYKFNNYFFGTADSTYLWTLPAGNQYITNASFTASTAGNVNVNLTATKKGWFANCTDSKSLSITVNANDNATFTYASNTICAGSPNITPTTTSAGTFTSTPAGLVFANAATGEIDVAASDEGAYSLTFNTSGACPATSTQTLTITSSPDASFSYGNAAYCLGSTNPSPVLGAGASAGTYSSTAGLVINAATGVIDLTASTAGSYTVTNTIAASGACPASSETFNVTINAQPTATISGGGSICAGSGNSVQVSVALTGTGPWSIVVSNGAANQTIPVTTSPATISVNEALAGTYTIVSVSNALCSNTGTGTAAVTVTPTPTVSAITNQSVCNGAASTIVSFSGPVAGTTFAWTNDNAAIGLAASGNGNIPTFTAVNTTGAPVTATITVTPTANGCVGAPNTFTYTINPSPAVTFTAPATVCVYNSAITLTPGTPAGGTFSGTGVTGSSFNPATAGLGTHTITYSVISGCTGTATANIVVSACASIEDIIANDGLAIYPNPSTGNVTFAFSNTEVNDVNLSIVSTEGKTVYQNNFQTTKATIDLSTLARGTYFVRVSMNGKLSTSKLILE